MISAGELAAIKRDKPTSETDFTFRIVTRDTSLRLDPGSRNNYQMWQEGLMRAVAVPSPQEQQRSILRQTASD